MIKKHTHYTKIQSGPQLSFTYDAINNTFSVKRIQVQRLKQKGLQHDASQEKTKRKNETKKGSPNGMERQKDLEMAAISNSKTSLQDDD